MTEVKHTTNVNLFGSLVIDTIFIAVCGYFVLNFDSDPQECLASREYDTRWISGSHDGYIDIGFKFRLLW
jgi:hypothetical protein